MADTSNNPIAGDETPIIDRQPEDVTESPAAEVPPVGFVQEETPVADLESPEPLPQDAPAPVDQVDQVEAPTPEQVADEPQPVDEVGDPIPTPSDQPTEVNAAPETPEVTETERGAEGAPANDEGDYAVEAAALAGWEAMQEAREAAGINYLKGWGDASETERANVRFNVEQTRDGGLEGFIRMDDTEGSEDAFYKAVRKSLGIPEPAEPVKEGDVKHRINVRGMHPSVLMDLVDRIRKAGWKYVDAEFGHALHVTLPAGAEPIDGMVPMETPKA